MGGRRPGGDRLVAERHAVERAPSPNVLDVAIRTTIRPTPSHTGQERRLRLQSVRPVTTREAPSSISPTATTASIETCRIPVAPISQATPKSTASMPATVVASHRCRTGGSRLRCRGVRWYEGAAHGAALARRPGSGWVQPRGVPAPARRPRSMRPPRGPRLILRVDLPTCDADAGSPGARPPRPAARAPRASPRSRTPGRTPRDPTAPTVRWRPWRPDQPVRIPSASLVGHST